MSCEFRKIFIKYDISMLFSLQNLFIVAWWNAHPIKSKVSIIELYLCIHAYLPLGFSGPFSHQSTFFHSLLCCFFFPLIIFLQYFFSLFVPSRVTRGIPSLPIRIMLLFDCILYLIWVTFALRNFLWPSVSWAKPNFVFDPLLLLFST